MIDPYTTAESRDLGMVESIDAIVAAQTAVVERVQSLPPIEDGAMAFLGVEVRVNGAGQEEYRGLYATEWRFVPNA